MLFVDRVLLTRREMVCDRVLDDLEQLHRGLGSSDAVLVQQLHHQSYKSKKKHYKICRYQLYDENKKTKITKQVPTVFIYHSLRMNLC